jgi:hypothetical protein
MIKNKAFKIRFFLVLLLVTANPLLLYLMKRIAWLQRQTFAAFLYASNYLEQFMDFKFNVLGVVSIAALFWPLIIALPLNYFIRLKTKFPNHPYIYLCFFWIIFNGSFILLR